MGDYIQLKADQSISKVRQGIKQDLKMAARLHRKIQPLYLMNNTVGLNVFERQLVNIGSKFGIPVVPYYMEDTEDWYLFMEEVDFNLSGVVWTGDREPKDWFKLLRAYPYCFDLDGVTVGRPAVVDAVHDIIVDNYLDERISGQPVLVIGRSSRVGMPMATMLSRDFNAVVTIAHSEMLLSDLKKLIGEHEYIVSCLPHNISLSAGYIHEHSTIIDVAGTLELPSSVEPWFDYTPPKGCIGPLTTYILLKRAVAYK